MVPVITKRFILYISIWVNTMAVQMMGMIEIANCNVQKAPF